MAEFPLKRRLKVCKMLTLRMKANVNFMNNHFGHFHLPTRYEKNFKNRNFISLKKNF